MGLDLARRRLLAQGVTGARFSGARNAVSLLCAVQAQDYLGALWAVGLRTRSCAEADVERAIVEHLLRQRRRAVRRVTRRGRSNPGSVHTFGLEVPHADA